MFGDTTKARIFYRDGSIVEYEDQSLAYAVWLALPKHIPVAFRGKDDPTPVYSHDYVYGYNLDER